MEIRNEQPICLGSLALCAAVCSAAHADDLSYFEKQIAPYTKKPEFCRGWPGLRCAGLYERQDHSQHSRLERQSLHRKYREGHGGGGKKSMGLQVHYLGESGPKLTMGARMDTAVNQKVDLIDLLAGTDPRVLVPQVNAAHCRQDSRRGLAL